MEKKQTVALAMTTCPELIMHLVTRLGVRTHFEKEKKQLSVRLFRQTFSLSTVWLPFFYYTGIWNYTVCDPGDPRQRLFLEGLHVLAIAVPRTDRTENTWARSYFFTELLAGVYRVDNLSRWQLSKKWEYEFGELQC
jgi:hypothetical protein